MHTKQNTKKFVQKSLYEKFCTKLFVQNSLYETVVQNTLFQFFLLENRVGNIPVGWPKSRLKILCAGLSWKWDNFDIYKAIKSLQAHNIQLSTCQERSNYSKAVQIPLPWLHILSFLFFFWKNHFFLRKWDYPVWRTKYQVNDFGNNHWPPNGIYQPCSKIVPNSTQWRSLPTTLFIATNQCLVSSESPV